MVEGRDEGGRCDLVWMEQPKLIRVKPAGIEHRVRLFVLVSRFFCVWTKASYKKARSN